MKTYSPGSVVTCRDRQWVVLPSEQTHVVRWRPLSGSEEEVCGIYDIAFLVGKDDYKATAQIEGEGDFLENSQSDFEK
jgi:hypothetical protein